MKEKSIEKLIANYLKTTWWLVESMQGWKVVIKKGDYNHRMTLNSTGCPDILYFKDNKLFWIEVKKDQKEVDEWLKLLDRYNWIWKSLDWLISYKREIWQFQYRDLLEKNGWQYLVTCSLQEVIDFMNIS